MTAATFPSNDTNIWTRKSAMIVALCFVLNMIDGMDLLVVSFLAPTLQKEWAVDASAHLPLCLAPAWRVWRLAGLGFAPLADKVGRRNMIVAAILMMATSMWVSSYANRYRIWSPRAFWWARASAPCWRVSLRYLHALRLKNIAISRLAFCKAAIRLAR